MKLTQAKVNIHDMLRITTHIVSMCSSGLNRSLRIDFSHIVGLNKSHLQTEPQVTV